MLTAASTPLAAASFIGWMIAGAGWHPVTADCGRRTDHQNPVPLALGLAVPAAQIVAAGALIAAVASLVKDGSGSRAAGRGLIASCFDKTGLNLDPRASGPLLSPGPPCGPSKSRCLFSPLPGQPPSVERSPTPGARAGRRRAKLSDRYPRGCGRWRVGKLWFETCRIAPTGQCCS